MKLYQDNARKVVTKHPSCIEVGECRPAHRGTKDTRHFCKGRVGVPHAWEWQRRRDEIERELRMGIHYNRITEVPICFGCEKVDYRQRSYCRECGEPWPRLVHVRAWVPWGGKLHRGIEVAPCVRCGARWSVRVGGGWVASGAVVPSR